MTTVGPTFKLVMFVWCRNEFNTCPQYSSVEGMEDMYAFKSKF